MALVVSDTSPVRALAHLENLAWLQDLFGKVVVPPAVARELQSPPGRLLAVTAADWPFIQVQAPSSSLRIARLNEHLDIGEAEAIALAEEVHADAILIDESDGRATAIASGLVVVGTLGILLGAKRVGLCSEVKSLLDRLQKELNFFVSASLREQILTQAGE